MANSAQERIDKIAKRENRGGDVVELLRKSRGEITKALPKHMDADRMIRLAVTSLRNNRRLQECSQLSFVAAVMQAAQLGLEPDGVLGQAYLIPYRNKGVAEVQFQIGYRGFIALAMRSGQVKSISAEVVYEGDKFDYSFGTDQFLKHRPALSGKGEPIGVYAIASLDGGGHVFRVLSVEDVEAVRKSSRAAQDGPWVTHWVEMARKTAVRALAKYLPMSVELQRAAVEDEYRDVVGATADVIDFETGEVLSAIPEQAEQEPG